ncbi:MAG: AMP-binding protein [Sphingomicrobium sp.]
MPASGSLFAGFATAATRWPGRIAIRDNGRDTSFAALHAASREAARALVALGIERGDRVAIWAVNHTDWIVAGLAIQAAGAVLVPLSTRLRAGEVASIIDRAEVRLLFCDPGYGSYDFVTRIAEEAPRSLERMIVFGDVALAPALSWSDFLETAPRFLDQQLDARIAAIGNDDLADIIFTSGTTGTPKGVPMTNSQSMIACAAQHRCVLQFQQGDVFAVTFPFAHNAGYRAGWQAALLHGVTIIPVRTYDPLALLTLIERERVTILPAVPTIFQMILDHPERGRFDLSSLRVAATGATTIPIALIEAMQTEFGATAVRTGYGLTECAGSVTATRPGDDAATIALTTGRPLDNLEVILLDLVREPVPIGETGEIAVRGPQVMREYYRDEAATAAAFTAEGYFLTGDIGRFDATGNLAITDRLKDMYIVGGFNTYPAEVEQQLARIAGVQEAAVIGVADERLGQVGHAFLVAQADAGLDETTVLDWCRRQMANYKVPRGVTFVDALPRTPSGKVSKVELRALAGSQINETVRQPA